MSTESSLVVSAFAALQTKQARQAALDQLLDLLQPAEWRRVHHRAIRALQNDIISGLPIELLVQVTLYWEPWDILRLQRVSKQWQARLSSRAVYQPVLRFYSIPETERNLSTEGFRTFCLRRYSLETGSVRGAYVHNWLDGPDFFQDGNKLCVVSYASTKIAWLSRDERRACVLDLQSNSVADFVPITRGIISAIQLFESILCVEASGYCIAWNLSTGEEFSVRIPSSSRSLEINIRANKVAFVCQNPARQHTLYSWNLMSGSLRSIQLDSHPLLTHLDEDANIITVIELDFPGEFSSRFSRKKYSIANDGLVLIASDVLSSHPRQGIANVPFDSPFRYNQYLCRRDSVVTQCLANHHPPILLSYHASTDKLQIHAVNNESIRPRSPELNVNQSKLLSPDGLVYSPMKATGGVWVHTLSPASGSSSSRGNTGHIAKFSVGNSRKVFQDGVWSAFGDEHMYGVVGPKGVAVWIF